MKVLWPSGLWITPLGYIESLLFKLHKSGLPSWFFIHWFRFLLLLLGAAEKEWMTMMYMTHVTRKPVFGVCDQVQYRSGVFFISHPSQWGRLFYPLQSHSRLQSNITCNFMTCTLWSPCNPTQMVGITVDYKTLILSIQFKQDKVYRSDSPHCYPTQSSSETLPVFSLQCFHRNGWNHSR